MCCQFDKWCNITLNLIWPVLVAKMVDFYSFFHPCDTIHQCVISIADTVSNNLFVMTKLFKTNLALEDFKMFFNTTAQIYFISWYLLVSSSKT